MKLLIKWKNTNDMLNGKNQRIKIHLHYNLNLKKETKQKKNWK